MSEQDYYLVSSCIFTDLVIRFCSELVQKVGKYLVDEGAMNFELEK